MMANNIFDYIKDDFFNIFVGNNYKRINYDILQFLYSKLSLNEESYSKNELLDLLIPFIENKAIETDKTLKEYCLERINVLIDFGWLIEDNDGFKKTYELDENGIKILEVLDEISKNETKQYEYTGYVYNIYSLLCKNFEMDKSIISIEQAYKACVDLRNNLKGLNSNIRKYLTNLIKNNKAQPKDILKIVLLEYQDKVIVKAFKNLRENDNPSLYKNQIIDKIYRLQEIRMESLIDTYIKIKCSDIDNQENRKIAFEEINFQLNTIYELFENIESIIQNLEIQNTKYISAAKARVNFLLNENRDLEGNIIDTLKQMEDVDDSFYEQDLFNLFEGLNIDDNSLYVQPTRKEKPESTIDELDLDDSDFDIEAFKQIILKDNDFSVDNINKFVMSFLKNRDAIFLSEISGSSVKDIIKLFLVIIYSNNKVIEYKIKPLNKKFVCLDWILDDYMIERSVVNNE